MRVLCLTACTVGDYVSDYACTVGDYVPEQKLHEDTFKGCDRKFSKPKAHALARQRHNTVKTAEQMTLAQRRATKTAKKSLAKMAALGVDYHLPGLVTKVTTSPLVNMDCLLSLLECL